jgi:hypothetical protein
MLLIFVTSSSRCLSFSLSARTERGPRGRAESSGEEGEGAEPFGAGFLAMILTRALQMWVEETKGGRGGAERVTAQGSLWTFPHHG